MKFLILSVSLIICSTVFAVEGERKSHPCDSDAKKLCSGVEKGGGRIFKCLKEHEKEISKECSTRLSERKSKMKGKGSEIFENCHGDMQTLCKDVAQGKGERMKCLKSKKDQVSPKCKAVLP